LIVVISKQYDVAILADRQDRRTPKENPKLDDGSASDRSGRPSRAPQPLSVNLRDSSCSPC
jgi:hypothetical protein